MKWLFKVIKCEFIIDTEHVFEYLDRNIPAVTNKNIDVLTNTVATSLKRERSDKCGMLPFYLVVIKN
jgi:hypothetical protein